MASYEISISSYKNMTELRERKQNGLKARLKTQKRPKHRLK